MKPLSKYIQESFQNDSNIEKDIVDLAVGTQKEEPSAGTDDSHN